MHIEPTSAVRIVTFLGKITSTWPCDPKAKSYEKVIVELRWIISLANVFGLLVPLSLGAYHSRHAPVAITKALSEFTALGDVFFNLIICKMCQKKLHLLLAEVNDYVKTVKGPEEVIFNKYVNRYFVFCIFVGCSYFQCAVAFSCGPLFTSQMLPADAWYPFTIEPFTSRHYLLYLQQVLTILQTGLCITVDFMVALLLSYSSTKLEMLAMEAKELRTNKQLYKFIWQHQDCIRFAERLANVVRFMILKSNATMAMAAVFGAFPIILHEPLPVISQFILMVIGGCLRLYVSAWPADDMKEKSTEIAWAIYESSWVDKPIEMQKSMAVIIHRAQKPLVISIFGVLPSVTLQSYAAFLSMSLSYFMTLRAVIGE